MAESLAAVKRRLQQEIAKVIIGQEAAIEELLLLLFAGGHGLLIGVPGLAKTLMVRTLAKAMELSFHRIQFTPDLMPSDITGTDVIEENRATGKREIRFVPGPIFAQVILADEINRTPPKTQAALLEAMQEGHVTIGNTTYQLPSSFLVLATQNPIEQEGTYPLPEAQLDRFMFMIRIDYPESGHELEIIRRESGNERHAITPVVTADDLAEIRRQVREVVVSEHVSRYALALCRATRPTDPTAPAFIREHVAWGAGPRAALHLVLAAKARAAGRGNAHVAVEDVQAVARPVLRHRVLLNFIAAAEAASADKLIGQLLAHVPEVAD